MRFTRIFLYIHVCYTFVTVADVTLNFDPVWTSFVFGRESGTVTDFYKNDYNQSKLVFSDVESLAFYLWNLKLHPERLITYVSKPSGRSKYRPSHASMNGVWVDANHQARRRDILVHDTIIYTDGTILLQHLFHLSHVKLAHNLVQLIMFM